MQPNEYKEVRFDLFCSKCVFRDIPQDEEPCNECLSGTTNLHSIKPIKFKEKKVGGNKNEEQGVGET